MQNMSIVKTINRYVSILRPYQWLKNLLLFFPPIFGGKIMDPAVVSMLIPAFVSFSCAASCGYILNDIKDRGADGTHPIKKNRAIASGDISPVTAAIIAAALYLTGMLVAGAVSARFEGYLVIYLFISLLYTMYFKDIVILDIFFVAFGFLIRVKAGGEAFRITVTSWLFLAVFLVALFLAAGKRLGEMVDQGEAAGTQRKSLSRYSSSYLEGVLWFTAAAALITYALYVIENRGSMLYTVPVAAYGLLRYIYIVKDGKGDPTEALLHDRHILATGVIWALMIGIVIYR